MECSVRIGVVVRDTADGAGSLGFDSWAGQIGHSVANVSPPLQRFFFWSCVVQAPSRKDGPRRSYHASAELCEYNNLLFFCVCVLKNC